MSSDGDVTRPSSVTRTGPDTHRVDLGQNINGWIRLTNLGPVGTTTTLTHGLELDMGTEVLAKLERK